MDMLMNKNSKSNKLFLSPDRIIFDDSISERSSSGSFHVMPSSFNNNKRRESLPSIAYITHGNSSSRNVNLQQNLLPENLQERRHSMHGSYSRSPELRVSHKLAERKRRKEMKDLFDDLRDLLPMDKTVKSSKWEILSKAVKYIDHLIEKEARNLHERDELKQKLSNLRSSNPF